jgi:hypothetical protein
VNTVDTAVTAAAILGTPMPASVTGRVVTEVFVPVPDVVPSDLPAY